MQMKKCITYIVCFVEANPAHRALRVVAATTTTTTPQGL